MFLRSRSLGKQLLTIVFMAVVVKLVKASLAFLTPEKILTYPMHSEECFPLDDQLQCIEEAYSSFDSTDVGSSIYHFTLFSAKIDQNQHPSIVKKAASSLTTSTSNINDLGVTFHTGPVSLQSFEKKTLVIHSQSPGQLMQAAKNATKETLKAIVRFGVVFLRFLDRGEIGSFDSHAVSESTLLGLQNSLGTANLAMALSTSVTRRQLGCKVYYICMFCCFEAKSSLAGRTCVRAKAATNSEWRKEIGFKGDFRTATMRVSYAVVFRNFYTKRTSRKSTEIELGKKEYGGSDYELLLILAKRMNFTLEVVDNPDGYFGAMAVNGTWPGLIGMLMRREIDFVLSALHMLPERKEVVDFSYPYDMSGLHIFQPRPVRIINKFAIFRPFTLRTWSLIAASMMFIAVLEIGTMRLFSRKTAEDNQDSVGESSWKLSQVFFALYSTALKQPPSGQNRQGRKIQDSVLLQFWAALTILLGIAYSTRLYDGYVIPQYTPVINTIADLINSDFKWYAYAGSYHENVARQVPGLGKIAVFEHPRNALKALNNIKDYSKRIVGITPPSLRLTPAAGLPGILEGFRNSDYYFGSDPVIPYWQAMGFPQNSPLAPAFDRVLLRMIETGIIEHNGKLEEIRSSLAATNFHQLRRNQRFEANRKEAAPLKLKKDLSAAFIALAVGWAVSLVVFMGETFNLRMELKKCQRQRIIAMYE